MELNPKKKVQPISSLDDPAISSAVQSTWIEFNERQSKRDNALIGVLNNAIDKQDLKIGKLVDSVHSIELSVSNISGKVDLIESKVLDRDDVSSIVDIKASRIVDKVDNVSNSMGFKIERSVDGGIRGHENDYHKPTSKTSSSNINTVNVSFRDWKQLFKTIAFIIGALAVGGTGTKIVMDNTTDVNTSKRAEQAK